MIDVRRVTSVISLVCASTAIAQGVPTVRLGAATASPTEQFTRISGLVELTGNRALVTDDKDGSLTVIDLAANTARVIGRKGAGPGEYRSIGRLFARPNGGAYLHDFAQHRLLPIADDATFDNPITLPASIQIRGIDARGVLYGEAFLPRQGTSLPDSMWIVRWDPQATRVDTIMKYNAAVSSSVFKPGDVRHVFPPIDTWIPLDGGDVLIIDARTYRPTVWSGGRARQMPVIPWQPVRFADADKRAFEREEAASKPVALGQAGANPSAPGHPTNPVEFPTSLPPFGGGGLGGSYLQRAPNGEIWIERLLSVSDSLPRYDVVNGRDGTLIGHVLLKPRETLVAFGKGTAFVAARDQDDIVTLKRYAYPVFATR